MLYWKRQNHKLNAKVVLLTLTCRKS